jgi:DNA-binding HxlR family transcriptional regulator
MIATQYPKPNVLSALCSSRLVLNHITSRWAVLVFVVLRHDTLRFSQIRRKIDGVSERMLSQTLKTLENDGFVVRLSYDVVPPHVEYHLTPMGGDMADRLLDMVRFIEGNLTDIMKAQTPILQSAL